MINIRQKQHGWNLKKTQVGQDEKIFFKNQRISIYFLWLCMTVVTVIVLKMDFERHLEIE